MKRIIHAIDGILYEIDTETSTKILSYSIITKCEKKLCICTIYLSKNEKVYYSVIENEVNVLSKDSVLKILLEKNKSIDKFTAAKFNVYEG